MSTFHGLEMAKQALFAQQSALYTTGHNISNLNTKGYSRQRVNLETMSPYPSASRNRPEIPGQMGTGVQIGTVERIRNQFLDQQFRAENSKAGYYEVKTNAFSRMEGILNEPSDSGLSSTMNEFWKSLQDLGTNPKNSGARAVVAERALALTETFNHINKSLNSIRTDLKSEMDATVQKANSLVRQINEINEQVQKVEPHGLLPNDLYDERDRLIDELSKIVNIKVSYDESSTSSLDIAQGIAKIELVGDKGQALENGPIYLLEGKLAHGGASGINELSVLEQAGYISGIQVGNQLTDPLATVGSLKGLIESYGYLDKAGDVKGVYPSMIADIDQMAYEFAIEFNRVHSEGKYIDEDGNEQTGGEFFKIENKEGAAGTITVVQEILDHPNQIAASKDGSSGNGDQALALGNVLKEPFKDADGTDLLGGHSVTGFYESLIGKLGVDGEEAKRMASNTAILSAQVERERMSVSAVSLDEEMANMIQFQHAYNAAARSMTSIDEMLDRIINGMGLVGR